MATYHLRVKTVSRGGGIGRSVVAAASYRSGERLTEAATGRVRDYSDRAERVQFAGIFLPFGAPAWARDRATLWNAVERIERRRDATLAREIELSLPHELTDRQRLQLVRDFVRENLVRRGLAVDVAIHGPDRGGDARNIHAHLLIAERPIGPRGFAAKKDRGLQSKATLYGWRANWATLCNRYLAAHGHAARVDHRSFRARGIRDRQPTVPLGPVATAMQRRGVATPRGARLRQVQARNALRQGWRDAGREAGRPAVTAAAAQPSCHQRRAGLLSAGPAPRPPTGAAAWIAPQSGARPATGHGSAGTGAGFKATASGVGAVSPPFRPPKLAASVGKAFASLAAVVPERAAPDAARELCSRGPPVQGRDPLPGVGADRSMADRDDGGEVEPCSYEAEAEGIRLLYARQIDGIRQTVMPRHLMEAAIKAVRDAQRAALVAVRERRYWRRQRPVEKLAL